MSDLISRQAAIDSIGERPMVWMDSDYEIAQRNQWDADKLAIETVPSAQPEQRWIPVTERLPEDDDYKSCIECLDGAVWYFTENGTMGLGYYYKSTKEWSTTGDLKTDGKVIAWMQLPEPYKEGAQK